jgi:hypothetical protein
MREMILVHPRGLCELCDKYMSHKQTDSIQIVPIKGLWRKPPKSAHLWEELGQMFRSLFTNYGR